MTTAQFEQKRFWKAFEAILMENGEPFSINYEMSGEVKFFASVNKKRARSPIMVSIDFLSREEIVKLNLYIENDVRLFNYIYSKKEQIESELGFKPEWILSGTRNPNTRRVIKTFPVRIGDTESYECVIEKMLPCIVKYISVFKKYVPNLFDY